MNGGRLEARQLRDPLAHIGAVGVEFFRLQHGIEDAEVGRGIDADARDPLPVERIAGGIGVDQRVPEPCLAASPVDEQVLDEERSNDQARAIGQISGSPQLAHAGVDDRVAGLSSRPGAETPFVVAPGKALERLPQATRRQIRMGVELRGGEVAPAKLGHIFFRRAGERRLRGGRGLDGVRNATRQRSRRNASAPTGARRRQAQECRARPRKAWSAPAAKVSSAASAPASPGASPRPSSPDQSGFVGLSLSASIETRAGASRGHGAAVRRLGAGVGAGRGPSARWRRQKAVKTPTGAPSGLAELGRLAHQAAIEARALRRRALERCLDARVERYSPRLRSGGSRGRGPHSPRRPARGWSAPRRLR